jgi:hypothetical protein
MNPNKENSDRDRWAWQELEGKVTSLGMLYIIKRGTGIARAAVGDPDKDTMVLETITTRVHVPSRLLSLALLDYPIGTQRQ